MSSLDVSQQEAAASPSPTASPVSSPTTAAPAATSAADESAPQPDEAFAAALAAPFLLSANERRGLLMVLGVALFQEVHSNIFRGVLVGAAAAGALYSQRSCATCQ